MSKTFKWSLVGDLQIPYQDNRAVALYRKAMKVWKPDAIDFLGDIDDQLEYSRFSDGTTDEFFNQFKKIKQLEDESDEDFERRKNPLGVVYENASEAKKFYTDIREDHPNADMHSSLGNHDIRIFAYMDKKAPEFLPDVTPNSLWGLDDLGITWKMYDEPPFKRFADIHVHHGATVRDGTLAVRADIENYDISLARGHDHRGGVVYKTFPLSSRRLTGIGAGHMCTPYTYGMKYTINPNWELGFAIVHVYNGVAQAQFIPITPDYECVIDGKLIKG